MIKLIRIILAKIVECYQKIYYSNEEIALSVNIDRAKKMGVNVGKGCRFFSLEFSSEPYLINIGDHVTITKNVCFSTHDGGTWVFRDQFPEMELFGRITIGNNVFVGMGSIILLNTNIPDNCIIAAGSVVKGSFEPNSVIAGVPAKRICSIEDYFEKNKSNFTYLRSRPNKNQIIADLYK